MPTEIEGPHGITVDPNGKYWYLSLAHGDPFGSLIKYSTQTNKPVGITKLGLFPASMQISTITGLLYCVNFNLHGDMVPSSVSVVDPESMVEIKQIEEELYWNQKKGYNNNNQIFFRSSPGGLEN